MEKKLRLKPNILDKSVRDVTRYQIAIDANVSKNTAYAILGPKARKMQRVDLDTLSAILIDGLGINENDLLDMKLGDFFTINGI